MSNLARVVVIAAIFLLLTSGIASAAAYQAPVDGKVTDKFRPPATPYGPGNRGWEYATTPGQPVKAAADGTVTFAGQVGGVLNVVIRHAGGVLTTYSKLHSISVSRGQEIRAGDVVGVAGSGVYFGARCDGRYIDPTLLFRSRVYLVPAGGAGSDGGNGTAQSCETAASPAQIQWLASGSAPQYWPDLRATLLQLHL